MTVKSIVAKYHDSFSEFMDKATDKEKIIVFKDAARKANEAQRKLVRKYRKGKGKKGFQKMPDPYLDAPCDLCGKTMRQSGDGFEFTPEGKVTCRTCLIKGVPKETLEKVKELLSKK